MKHNPTIIIRHTGDKWFPYKIKRAGRVSATNPAFLARNLAELLSWASPDDGTPFDRDKEIIAEKDRSGEIIGEYVGRDYHDHSHMRDF